MTRKSSIPVFDLSVALRQLALAICQRVPELQHIRCEQLLFCLSRSRSHGQHGTYARIVPLRFANGQREMARRRGRLKEVYQLPSITHHEQEILYLIYIFVPRFLRLSQEERLRTLVHELFHISERFDGDIRRFKGRNYAHGSSRRKFNAHIDALVATFLQSDPPPEVLGLMQIDEQDWQQRRVRLVGLNFPLPRAKLVARTPP